MRFRPGKRDQRLLGWGEQGFTLIETMVAVILLVVGVLGLLEVFPRGLRLGVYGNDQGKASALSLQRLEFYRNQSPACLAGCTPTLTRIGDYGQTGRAADAGPEYFDVSGQPTAASSAYYTRDVQVQYWTWTTASASCGGAPPCYAALTPYTAPGSGVSYVFRVSVATHWVVRAQTTGSPRMDVYTPTGSGASGCVVNSASVPMGPGCIEVTTFITP